MVCSPIFISCSDGEGRDGDAGAAVQILRMHKLILTKLKDDGCLPNVEDTELFFMSSNAESHPQMVRRANIWDALFPTRYSPVTTGDMLVGRRRGLLILRFFFFFLAWFGE